jgi:hypothetical protein
MHPMLHNAVAMPAFFQLGGNQLNTFENFLHSAVIGIQGAGIISGMTNVSYVVMLVGFLWEMYQAASQGGDVKGFGRSAAKYLACALVVQAWPEIFTEVNQAFVNAGAWMTGQGGASNVLDTWMQQIQAQYNQDGFQHMWNLITGAVSGLLDAILIFVAYLLYPIVTIIFGFFYMLLGSILYIFGPLVVALLPLAPANRLAKSYIEHVFIWNAWPILYGGLGLLVSLVNIGNVQNILNAQDFLGGLNGVEGSILAGIISIVYSIAIAVIPFMAKSIVSGDVGSAARSMMSAATAALGIGIAAGAGAIAGASAAGGSAASASSSAPGSAGNAANATAAAGGPAGTGNQPAASQPAPTPSANSQNAASSSSNSPAASSSSSTQQSSNSGTQSAGSESSESSSSGSGGGGSDSGTSQSSPAQEAAAKNTAQAKEAAQMLQGIQAKEENDQPPQDQSTSETPSASAMESSGATTQSSGNSSNQQSSGAGTSMGSSSGTGSAGSGQRSNSPGRAGGGGGSNAPRLPVGGIGSWGAYHAARLATQGAVGAGNRVARAGSSVASSISNAIKDPVAAGEQVGQATGDSVGRVVSSVQGVASNIFNAVSKGADAISHPGATAQKTVDGIKNAASEKGNQVRGAASSFKSSFVAAYKEQTSPQEDQTKQSND